MTPDDCPKCRSYLSTGFVKEFLPATSARKRIAVLGVELRGARAEQPERLRLTCYQCHFSFEKTIEGTPGR